MINANAQRPTRPRPTTTTTYTPPPPKPTPYIFKVEFYIDENVVKMREAIKNNIENWVKTKFGVQKYDAVVVDQPTVTPVAKLFQYIIKFHYGDGTDLPRPTVEAATIMNAYHILPDMFNVSKFWYDDTLIPPPPPPPHVTVTLIPRDPGVKFNGLVTITVEGVLDQGTVCKQRITQSAMRHFCERAGFPSSDFFGYVLKDTTELQENLPINWVNVNCDTAPDLDRCKRDRVRDTRFDCLHTDDVYVNCYKTSHAPTVPVPWNGALSSSVYPDFTKAPDKFMTRLGSFLTINKSSVTLVKLTPDLKITFSFGGSPMLDVGSVDSLLASWNYEPSFLIPYLGLTDKLVSETTVPFALPSSFIPGYELSLSGGIHGRVTLMPSGNVPKILGTIGVGLEADKTVALVICALLLPDFKSYGVIKGAPGGSGPVYLSNFSCLNTTFFENCTRKEEGRNSSVIETHGSDLGVLCSQHTPPPSPNALNTWGVTFVLTTVYGFSVEVFTAEVRRLMTVNESRIYVYFHQHETPRNTGKLAFYFTDQTSHDTPRIDLEYFFLNTNVTWWPGVTNMTFYYGEPKNFTPTNTTGWEWRLIQRDPKVRRGLLQVKPLANLAFGTVCGDKFDFKAAVAFCMTLFNNTVIPLAYWYYDEDEENRGPIYAGSLNCPFYGEPASRCQLVYEGQGKYPCDHLSDVNLDCTGNRANYLGPVNFTMVVKQSEAAALLLGLSSMTRVDGTRFAVGAVARYGDYQYLEVVVPPKRSARPRGYEVNQVLLSAGAIDFFRIAKVYETRDSLKEFSGDYDVTLPPSFSFTPIEYPAYDRSLGGTGYLRVFAGENSRRGTVCGKGLNLSSQAAASFGKAVKGLCKQFNYPNVSVGRVVKNFLPGDDVIFLSNLNASDDPPYLNGVISRAYEKKNDCTHMDDVGIMCGTNLRPPSPTGPMMFTATVRTAVSDEVFTTCVLQKLLGIPGSGNMSGGIAINGTHSYPDGTKGFDYTLLNDDDAIAMTMINTYQMDQLCSIKHFVVSKPYGSLTIAPTSATSAPPSGGGSGKSSSSLPIIIGIIIAVVVVAAVIGGVVFYLKKRAAAAESSEGEEGGKGGDYTLSQPMNEVPEVEDGKDGDDM